MSDFYQLNNYRNQGKLNISRKVFENIALITANKISDPEGQNPKKKSRPFRLSNPVKVYLRKGGKVEIHLDLSLKKGSDVALICDQVQGGIASAISTMCEAVPFKVKINVTDIK